MESILPIFGIIVLIFSVMVHEISHGAMALHFGDETAKRAGRLTFNPIKHIDPVGSVLLPGFLLLTGGFFVVGWAKPVPYNPMFLSNQKWGPALVAAAGPLSNIILAVALAIVYQGGQALEMVNITSAMASLFQYAVIINLSLAVLNSIPVPPLDGAEVLKALLPVRSPLYEGMSRLESLGMFAFPLGLLVFLVIGGPIIAVLSRVLLGVSLFG